VLRAPARCSRPRKAGRLTVNGQHGLSPSRPVSLTTKCGVEAGVRIAVDTSRTFQKWQYEGLNLGVAWLSRGLAAERSAGPELEDVQLLDGVAIAPVAKPL